MSRANRVIKNLLSEILPQIVIMILGLIKSKYYLNYLGGDTVGLVSLFSQIIGYLSLVEGGIGQAVIYRLYNPIVNKDYKKISKIKNGTRSIFRKIIIIIIALSVLVGFIIPFLIKDNQFSFSYIIINFILYVISEIILYTTVFERSMYIASERSYKVNRIIKTSLIFKHVCEILLAVFIKNISIIFICLIAISIIENIIIRIISKRDFSNLPVESSEDKSVLKDVKNLIVHKIAGLVATNIDIILISKFLGLSKVLIYSTYLIYFNAIVSFTNRISRAMVGTIGNIIVEDKSSAMKAFKELNGFAFLTSLLIVGPFNFLINYFITLFYDGKVATSIITATLFTLVLTYNIIRIPLITYTEAAGLFKETKICPIIESIVNLLLSIILINFYGINGCLIGTFVSLIVSEYVIKSTIIFRKIFDKPATEYYKTNILFVLLLVIQLVFSIILQKYIIINSLPYFILYASIYFVLNVGIVLGCFKIFRQDYVFKRIGLIGLWKNNMKK